jgi:hypothetical protein
MKEDPMPEELPPDDLRSVWQCQTVEHTVMSLDKIRERARKYQGKIRFRNSLEYAAVVFITLFFGRTIRTVHHLVMQVGAGLCIAGGWYMAWQLYKRGAARAVPADLAAATCLGFHRGELVRQRDLLRDSWSWYLGPLIPGLVVLTLGAGLANPGHLQRAWTFVGGYSVLAAGAFLIVRRYHLRGVRRLQTQIDELDSLEKQS